MGRKPTVIVSPHYDDAVLSLGGWIAAETEAGRSVRVITAFGNSPEDTGLPAGPWDERGGFTTAVEAVRARRSEDEAAVRSLGAELAVLPFPDSGYLMAERSESLFLEAIAPHLADAAEVFLPGFPLIHADHRWLAGLDYSRVGDFKTRFYVEQPYARWNRSDGRPGVEVEHVPVRLRHLRRKLAAIRRYKSQVPLLGGWRLFAGVVANDLFGPGEGLCERPDARLGELTRTAGDDPPAVSSAV